jgi:hypothetical protein
MRDLLFALSWLLVPHNDETTIEYGIFVQTETKEGTFQFPCLGFLRRVFLEKLM